MGHLVPCLALGCLLGPGLANAQPMMPVRSEPDRVSGRLELWGGLTIVAPRVDSAFTTTYVPVIERFRPPLDGSEAGQTARLKSSMTLGFEAGVNYFFQEHAGLQLFVDYDRVDLSGNNDGYQVLLNYTAMQPPDYVSRPYSYSRTDGPCGMPAAEGCVGRTTGHLRQATLGFDLVGRWRLDRRVTGGLSAGLNYAVLWGNAQPLRYTVFEMGGHSTLFSQEYQLAYSVGSARAFGFNAGGAVDIELTSGVFLVADARYFNGADLSAAVKVTSVLNREQLVFLQDVATVQQTLHPPDVAIAPARARIVVGVKVRR